MSYAVEPSAAPCGVGRNWKARAVTSKQRAAEQASRDKRRSAEKAQAFGEQAEEGQETRPSIGPE